MIPKNENHEGSINTLESGIVVLVGINVLVRTFAKVNKRTGGNKHNGGKFFAVYFVDHQQNMNKL